MRKSEFRKEHFCGIRDPHIKAVNDFVDHLRKGEASVPHIAPRETRPWNASPWHHVVPLKAADWEKGDAVLVELIDQMPNLRLILLQGRPAMPVWDRVVKKHPRLVAEDIRVLRTWSPGRLGVAHKDPKVIKIRRQERIDVWNLAGAILRSED